MLAVVGTIPDPAMPVCSGQVRLQNQRIHVADFSFAADRGTPALLGAAAVAFQTLGLPMPYAWLVGDDGRGQGSRELYRHLVEALPGETCSTLVFHYLMPDVMWHDKMLFAVEGMRARPRLIADAGFMYAAKMSGQAISYDLFTPDAGELAFLADETAPHPFYTRGFILHEDNHVPDLLQRAFACDNAAATLLVKGKTDFVADKNGVLFTVDGPSEEAMEAIGGTGDTLTAVASALIEAGHPVPVAAKIAARTNRLAGHLACLNPGSPIAELIPHIPAALRQALAEEHAS